jgi:DNA-binding IscR family transcriptional regulator
MREMSSARGRDAEINEADVFFAIKNHEDEVVKVDELADALGVSGPTVRKRLHELRELGVVKSKRFGSGEGWWLSQEAPGCSEFSEII